MRDTIQWSESFQTGIEDVDGQHRSLVDMVNALGRALALNDRDPAMLDGLVRKLAVYARGHFATEEAYMGGKQLDSRHFEEHVREHRLFVEDIGKMSGKIDSENGLGYQQLFNYLVHWLAYHILGMDKRMSRQAGHIGKGMSPVEAYEFEMERAEDTAEPFVVALTGLLALVSENNRKLEALNRTLERRVEERTHELLEANKALEVLTVTDALTGLPNRRFAMRQLEIFWNESRESRKAIALLMIDADNFKWVNDTYGHDAGDAVLLRLARELHHSVRTDDLVCRLGGDEFLVICPDTGIEGAVFLADQVSARIRSLSVPAGTGFWKGSVSIGVAVSQDSMSDQNELIKAADMAVYRAKDDGRNCVRVLSDKTGL